MASDKPIEWDVGAWMRDPGVRTCGLAARGLWFDALCLMWESSKRGYLQHANGQPMTPAQLARAVGASAEQVEALLGELEAADVFSRTEAGVIYSRRMTRDAAPKPSRRKAEIEGPPAPKAVRARDPLFDAVAEVTGRDNAGQIAKACQALRAAEPPYTPEEVREFARRFWELCPWAQRDGRERPTPTEIPNHIGQLRAGAALLKKPPAPIKGRAGAQIDHAISSLFDAMGENECPPTTKPSPDRLTG